MNLSHTFTPSADVAYCGYLNTTTSVGGKGDLVMQVQCGYPEAAHPTAEELPIEVALTEDRGRIAVLERTLDEVLGQFTRKGHPGMPCLKTHWIREDTVRQWRDVLNARREVQ